MTDIKIGIVGLSDGNGHPFSFSAIVNGFDNEAMKNSGWDGIYQYLIRKDFSDFGFNGVEVTHVWTQDLKISRKIASASKIKNVVSDLSEMIGQVDAVIIARDDWQTHMEMSKEFLLNDIPVFIDKPLSLDLEELKWYKPFLDKGLLFSCSGIRFSPELDDLRGGINEFGTLKLIRGAVIKSWEKYAIHMLDGVFGVQDFDVHSIYCTPGKHSSISISTKEGTIIQIDALGDSDLTLHLDFWSDKSQYHASTLDSFVAFRRALAHFIKMIRTKEPVISSDLTIKLMKILIAGNISKDENRVVLFDELDLIKS